MTLRNAKDEIMIYAAGMKALEHKALKVTFNLKVLPLTPPQGRGNRQFHSDGQ